MSHKKTAQHEAKRLLATERQSGSVHITDLLSRIRQSSGQHDHADIDQLLKRQGHSRRQLGKAAVTTKQKRALGLIKQPTYGETFGAKPRVELIETADYESCATQTADEPEVMKVPLYDWSEDPEFVGNAQTDTARQVDGSAVQTDPHIPTITLRDKSGNDVVVPHGIAAFALTADAIKRRATEQN